LTPFFEKFHPIFRKIQKNWRAESEKRALWFLKKNRPCDKKINPRPKEKNPPRKQKPSPDIKGTCYGHNWA